MSIRSLALGSIAALGLSAAMRGFDYAAPAMGGHRAPRFEDRAPEYDGLGRKKRRVVVPEFKGRSRSWRDYAARVVSTHSDRLDPRDDKYLHSHARRRRAAATVKAAA